MKHKPLEACVLLPLLPITNGIFNWGFTVLSQHSGGHDQSSSVLFTVSNWLAVVG